MDEEHEMPSGSDLFRITVYLIKIERINRIAGEVMQAMCNLFNDCHIRKFTQTVARTLLESGVKAPVPGRLI